MSRPSPKNDRFTKELIESQFWEIIPLKQMNEQQWEAICDGCGKCCLHKLIDEENAHESPEEAASTDEVYYTEIICHLFDESACECTSYSNRSELVPECITLTPQNIDQVYFMPPSCSYKRLQEGRGLASWHPLLNSGKKTKMHKKSISVIDKVVKETSNNVNDYEEYIVLWPLYDCD